MVPLLFVARLTNMLGCTSDGHDALAAGAGRSMVVNTKMVHCTKEGRGEPALHANSLPAVSGVCGGSAAEVFHQKSDVSSLRPDGEAFSGVAPKRRSTRI